jgi:glutamine amidotransferase-like uncharacterized protein
MNIQNGKYPKLRIAYLSYMGLCTEGICEALRYMYPNADIKWIYPQHLRSHVLKSYDMLILPGISDEDSVYPSLLPPEKIDMLKKLVSENGLILWTFCAASYFMFDKISYQKRNGQFKERAGSGLIKGYATHGFNHITRQHLNRSPSDDFILAAVNVDDHKSPLHTLNINGPTLFPDTSKEDDLTSFMRYQDIKGDAGVIKRIGKGMLIALGVHPEISPIHKHLPQSYAAYEQDRFTLLTLIKEKIAAHYLRLSPILSTPALERHA